jgi:hypothetical protein
MSKKIGKRLFIEAEIIRTLSSTSLDAVVGGAAQDGAAKGGGMRSLPPSVIDGCPSTPVQCHSVSVPQK